MCCCGLVWSSLNCQLEINSVNLEIEFTPMQTGVTRPGERTHDGFSEFDFVEEMISHLDSGQMRQCS